MAKNNRPFPCVLSIPTYDAHSFSWQRERGIADASELCIAPGEAPGRRVWPDAADVGFFVKGVHETKLFTLAKEGTAEDGSIERWDFVSHPDMQFVVTVFND